MNAKQKIGVGMLVSGAAFIAASFFGGPALDVVLKILGALAPMFGLVLNLPSDTGSTK